MSYLSQQAKDEFKAIYREEFKKDITDDQADEMGTRLLRLFDLLGGNARHTQKPSPSHHHPDRVSTS